MQNAHPIYTIIANFFELKQMAFDASNKYSLRHQQTNLISLGVSTSYLIEK